MNKNSHIKQGVAVENLNTEVSPKENFYEYACGGWMKNHPLPPDFSRYGSFDLLMEEARKRLKDLILELPLNPQTAFRGTNAQKISDLYSMGMDYMKLNDAGNTPLLPYLEKIEKTSRENLTETLSWLHKGLTGSFFSSGVGPDPENSDINMMHIGEAGLGLGDRDYYLEVNENNTRILSAYREYIQTIIKLAGFDGLETLRICENVLFIETEFARHKMTREQTRNPLLRHNPMKIEEIKEKYGFIDWDVYFSNLEVYEIETANVSSPGFMAFLSEFIETLSDRQIRDYLIFDIVSDSTGVLSDSFHDASFNFYGKIMSGKKEDAERWKRVMTIPNSMLGEAVGELYVSRYFPAEHKERMKIIVENLRSALKKHIKGLPWMSLSTKTEALRKLEALRVKIGYPDVWKDYSGIDVDPSLSYMENITRASHWYATDNYAKLGKPVDKSEWHMYPQTVNAYYSPSANEICFPAAILQPPYFNPDADDALNYGAIGVVIGHEMTHAFDDQGRHFDSDGNLRDWWEPEDEKRFNNLADNIADQFDEVEVAPGVHANGRFTLGENIADQGGLRVALTAFLESKGPGYNPEMDIIDGFNALQRFYLSYASVWAGNIRPEEILVRVKSDPHSLGLQRVNETLKNLDTFMTAFGIIEGDGMWRPENKRTVIW